MRALRLSAKRVPLAKCTKSSGATVARPGDEHDFVRVVVYGRVVMGLMPLGQYHTLRARESQKCMPVRP